MYHFKEREVYNLNTTAEIWDKENRMEKLDYLLSKILMCFLNEDMLAKLKGK